MIEGPRLDARSGRATSLVVFLHGYGADGNDLIAIGREWSRQLPNTAFASPHAPGRCAMTPMGREWFPLTLRDPEEYRRGAREAAPTLDTFLDEELSRLDLGPDRMALVGFSQGTMMALEVGLVRKAPPAGIVGYSGLIANPERLNQGERAFPPVLLVHGAADEVIPVAALFGTVNALSAAKIPVEFHVRPGLGHGIDPDGMAMGCRFLRDRLDGVDDSLT